MPFRKILVPYDGSKLSDKSLNQAIELATVARESKVILLQVMEEIPIPPTFSNQNFHSYKTGGKVSRTQFFKEINKDKELDLIERLNKIKTRYAKKSTPITVRVLVGNPADNIIKFAEQEDVDLIVIGSAEEKGISGFIKGLGSVSRKVSEGVACPVLIMR